MRRDLNTSSSHCRITSNCVRILFTAHIPGSLELIGKIPLRGVYKSCAREALLSAGQVGGGTKYCIIS
ncbi:pheromone precursor [Melampsora larici-populina 98AG31]|uniref:Pheromone n=1 Tax=Melampsora larici-populina (strain 98AG31 / pathotype 3-4-7) TaxID=747676 RepID=F4S9Q8_MELLP|nr:pheromone precursor [Melampsora larici-populina 98AG31]EGF98625.1 pheromone precursor [Melampsora larici-populina 98AG31]